MLVSKPHILLIDNFDSFTYNVVELLRKIGHSCDVVSYDKFDIERTESYSHIIISPGPGHPDEYTKHYALLNRFKHNKKILGICLGHQIIARYYGGELINLPQVRHGIASEIHLEDEKEVLFRALKIPIIVGRYHSWAVAESDFPKSLKITSNSDEGIIMSLRHESDDVCGIQFHPESIITNQGVQMLANWLNSD
ncbi:MAG: aminodeoxychorismate/anthranilate synthase component II [Desulfobulbaceae bacterium]|nr:aminodeoxychorismate/anthranilate synthase component II [Candidatus Kapabacteria bacterium]MBS4001025.1 aminodeoxychorismate/anthranilate synthase component II [Desulfobulbaceae bacterium]